MIGPMWFEEQEMAVHAAKGVPVHAIQGRHRLLERAAY